MWTCVLVNFVNLFLQHCKLCHPECLYDQWERDQAIVTGCLSLSRYSILGEDTSIIIIGIEKIFKARANTKTPGKRFRKHEQKLRKKSPHASVHWTCWHLEGQSWCVQVRSFNFLQIQQSRRASIYKWVLAPRADPYLFSPPLLLTFPAS